MDPLTHAALGAVSGIAVRRVHLHTAAIAGAAGAMLPDADVLIRSDTDPLLAVEFHRHFSHALVSAPVGALLVAGLLWLVLRRSTSFAALYWPALAGFISAIVLDACTSYGTRIWWPFSDTRVALGIVAVVDPVFTLALIVGLYLALRTGRGRWAGCALALCLLYLGLGWFQHQRAAHWAANVAAARGHEPEQVVVKPTLGNLVLWRSIYRADGRYHVDAIRVGLKPGSLLYPGETAPMATASAAARGLPEGSVQALDLERFAILSEGFIAPHPDDDRIIGDIRYALLPTSVRPLWAIELDPGRADHHARFRLFRKTDSTLRETFRDMVLGRDLGRMQRLP